MDAKAIQKVNEQVYKKYPLLKGKKPGVKSYTGANFLLVYSGKSKTPDGKSINISVRVVASESGKITKISSSK